MGTELIMMYILLTVSAIFWIVRDRRAKRVERVSVEENKNPCCSYAHFEK